MQLTPQLKERLTKDFQIPIFFYDEKYEYFKNNYDSFFEISKKEQMMLDVVQGLSSDGDLNKTYFDYASRVNGNLKDLIRNSEAFKQMNEFEIKKDPNAPDVPKTNIYNEENVGKRLISLDLNKANFNVFNLFGLSDELGLKGYESFVKRATPFEYFTQSRMTRQVVFGDLNPARQQAVQKSKIREFSKLFFQNGINVSSSSSDEIILVPNNSLTVADVSELMKSVNFPKEFYRIEEFSFEQIADRVPYYFKTTLKEDGTKKQEFKGVPGNYFAQVFKKKFNLPLEENDMLFEYEGKLSKFIDSVFPSIELVNKRTFRPK